jgi:photosystem II stability/assembly factor-like uncharacterized protein
MTERQLKSGVRRLHRWLGVFAAILVVVAGVTGFLLQHPDWLGPAANDPLSLAIVGDQWFRGTAWGVEKSTDGGATWHEVPMLAPPLDVVRVLAAPGDPRRIFALGRGVLVRSADGGRLWEEVPIDIPGPRERTDYLDLAVTASGELGLLTDRGLLASTDGGSSWQWRSRVAVDAGEGRRQWLHDLHTGRLFGQPGRLLTEAGAVALIVLTVSGLVIATRRTNGRRT